MIWCCKDCVAPKRRPGCHGSCPEYLVEKAEHDKQRIEQANKDSISRRDKLRARAIKTAIAQRQRYKD